MRHGHDRADVRHDDRTPPYSMEAEQSVLGAIMLSREPSPTSPRVLLPEDFYKDAHRKIYEVAWALYARGEPVDPMTVAEALRTQGDLESVGRPFLPACPRSMVPTTVNAVNYAEIVPTSPPGAG